MYISVFFIDTVIKIVSWLSKQNIAVNKRAINENGTKYLGNILNNQSCQFSVCPDRNQRVLLLLTRVF